MVDIFGRDVPRCDSGTVRTMSALGAVSALWRLYLKTQMSQKGLSGAEGER